MNLKTEQGRKAAIEEIETSFINSLREIGMELSDEFTADLNEFSAGIFYNKTMTHGVIIYSKLTEKDINKISFGSSGSFSPKNKEAYWRTIHAASILKNWEKVCEAVNEHCQRYSELVNQIQKENP